MSRYYYYHSGYQGPDYAILPRPHGSPHPNVRASSSRALGNTAGTPPGPLPGPLGQFQIPQMPQVPPPPEPQGLLPGDIDVTGITRDAIGVGLTYFAMQSFKKNDWLIGAALGGIGINILRRRPWQ